MIKKKTKQKEKNPNVFIGTLIMPLFFFRFYFLGVIVDKH